MKKTLKVLLTFALVIGLIAASPKTINASNGIKVVLEGKWTYVNTLDTKS